MSGLKPVGGYARPMTSPAGGRRRRTQAPRPSRYVRSAHTRATGLRSERDRRRRVRCEPFDAAAGNWWRFAHGPASCAGAGAGRAARFVTHRRSERDLSMVAGCPNTCSGKGFQLPAPGCCRPAMVPPTRRPASRAGIEVGARIERLRIRSPDGHPIPGTRAAAAERFPACSRCRWVARSRPCFAEHFDVTPPTTWWSGSRWSAPRPTRQRCWCSGPIAAAVDHRVARDAAGRPFEHSHDLFRADRTTITVRTRGDRSVAHRRSRGEVIEISTQSREGSNARMSGNAVGKGVTRRRVTPLSHCSWNGLGGCDRWPAIGPSQLIITPGAGAATLFSLNQPWAFGAIGDDCRLLFCCGSLSFALDGSSVLPRVSGRRLR